MGQKNVVAPRLPAPPAEYDIAYMSQLLSILRLYFNQVDNSGPMEATTQRNGTEVIAAMSFPAVPNTVVPSLPTEADLSYLRIGDVYYDTSASNVLKVKT
jgi:hypothetical protein